MGERKSHRGGKGLGVGGLLFRFCFPYGDVYFLLCQGTGLNSLNASELLNNQQTLARETKPAAHPTLSGCLWLRGVLPSA